MFRLTQILRALLHPSDSPSRSRALSGTGPVVVWNLIRRCNLDCVHCYSASSDRDFEGELTTPQALGVLDDMKGFRVPAVILSGGEPLMRPDVFEIAAHAKSLGFYLGLSTNGTLIDDAMADRIAEAGFDYVGISLDGLRENHDRIRNSVGSFDKSLAGLRRCRERGAKVGTRFTVTRENADDLPAMLDLLDAEGIDRFYLSHLNYAGRGGANREEDAAHLATRRALLFLFETAVADLKAGRKREIVTGNNDADGPFLLQWIGERHPDLYERAEAALLRWGGNASGVGIANIDNRGQVHPDIFWWNHTIGNVKEKLFSEIWRESTDPLMLGLREKPRPLKGRCATCRYLPMCNGNTRVRAHQTTGDAWAEDPGCYLTDAEIAL